MVRRGLMSSAFKMRTASIITMVPAPLSVAPVPACQESRWAPSMTTSSFLSVRRNFGDGVVLHGIVVVESVGDVQFERSHLFSAGAGGRCASIARRPS